MKRNYLSEMWRLLYTLTPCAIRGTLAVRECGCMHVSMFAGCQSYLNDCPKKLVSTKANPYNDSATITGTLGFDEGTCASRVMSAGKNYEGKRSGFQM